MYSFEGEVLSEEDDEYNSDSSQDLQEGNTIKGYDKSRISEIELENRQNDQEVEDYDDENDTDQGDIDDDGRNQILQEPFEEPQSQEFNMIPFAHPTYDQFS